MDGATLPAMERRGDSGTAADLLITAHFVFRGRVGGAEHMLYNVVRGLDGTGTPLRVLCADRGNLDPGFVAGLDAVEPGRLVECGGGAGPRFISEQRACLRGDLRSRAVLFPNYFVPPVVPRRLGRVVSVLHDMQFRHFPANFSARKRAWLSAAQAFAMRRSDTVVAISNFVRDDMLRHYGRSFAGKVVTIPNPISWERFHPAGPDEERPLPAPYILSVAAAYAHKNLEVLLLAFAEVARRDKDLMLVFCGQDYAGLRGVSGQRRTLGDMAAELGLQDRVRITGYVDDATLGRWYRHAALFAFPSLFEGFGMPPVEALGFGLPTLTTARTAMPETTLGLTHMVQEPEAVGAWAEALRDAIARPARYAPSAADVARLRYHYSPTRIGNLYAAACLG